MVVRPSAVAGQFYPGNADRLRKQVVDLLANIAMPIKNTPEALIAPHAGYVSRPLRQHLRRFAMVRRRSRASCSSVQRTMFMCAA